VTDHPLRILFVSSEVEGLVKTGGLADVAKALPLALKQRGHDVCIMIPFYKTLNRREEAVKIAEFSYDYAGQSQSYSVFKLMIGEVPVYCIDHNGYFYRDHLYHDGEQEYPDNGERFTFLCSVAFQAIEGLGFQPDIIHCNDWHTGLIPYLLRTRYASHPFFSQTKTVLTVHNAAYQGIFERSQFNFIGESSALLIDHLLNGYQCINLMKTAIRYADKICAVSPNYAAELLTRLGSHGLYQYFESRREDLAGILNGCDYSDWDPQNDPLLPFNYSASNMQGKWQCKSALQKEVGLPVIDTPVFGMVCRLTEQKGFFLLLPALQKFLRHKVQVVLVGTGEKSIASKLEALQVEYPDKFKFIDKYSNPLAHLVEAGGDFFLMPSLFEPCGLNQMYSLAYGTLPIVRGVGGLKDTVHDYDQDPNTATGLVFYEPEPIDLLNTLRRALLLYLEEPDMMQQMRVRAMDSHFSWMDSCIEYEALYQRARA
jgi:starch synthase